MKKLSFVLAVGMILLWIVISLGAIILTSTAQASLSESSSSSQDSFDKKFELTDEGLIPPPKYTKLKEFSSSSSEEKQEKKPEKKQISKKEEVVEVSGQRKIGRCRLTIYTPTETHWGYTTSTGVRSEHLKTCAVDPRIIPYGSTVILKAGDTELRLKAVDCGNFRGKMIDVFYDGSVSDGVNYLINIFGSEYAEVWIER